MDLVKARAEARQKKQSYASKVDAWARETLAPLVREQDRTQCLSKDVLSALRAAGFLGLELGPYAPKALQPEFLPDCAGIAGVAEAIRALSRTDPGVGVLVHVHNALAVRCLLKFGSEDQKSRWLPVLAQSSIGAFAATEPQAGSDLSMIETNLTDVPDGGFVLNGRKHWITNAAEAGLFLVFARYDKGTACALVPHDAPGVEVGARIDKMSMRASSTCAVSFHNVKVAENDILGGLSGGMDVAMYGLVNGRVGIAAQMLGLAEGAHRRAVAYAKNRQAFGKNVIEFQGLAFPLAQARADMTAVELTLKAAAEKADTSRSHMAALELADTAKLLAAQVANRVAALAVETLGGNGVAEAYEVEKFYRDALVGKIYEGTENVLLRGLASTLERGQGA
jgi:alkylation response protein AidB-like acyl-CoA dehydrogenase